MSSESSPSVTDTEDNDTFLPMLCLTCMQAEPFPQSFQCLGCYEATLTKEVVQPDPFAVRVQLPAEFWAQWEQKLAKRSRKLDQWEKDLIQDRMFATLNCHCRARDPTSPDCFCNFTMIQSREFKKWDGYMRKVDRYQPLLKKHKGGVWECESDYATALKRATRNPFGYHLGAYHFEPEVTVVE